MIASHIRGQTRDIGKPDDWDDVLDGPCASLPVRDEIDVQSGANVMFSLWYPNKEEIEILNSGGGIRLGVVGHIHPIVNMEAVL